MKRTTVVLVIILLAFNVNFAQNAHLQGDLVLTIARHITWPVKDMEYKFIIGVIGNQVDFQIMQRLASTKKTIHNYPIEVRYFDCTDKISECHLVYVSEECKFGLESILAETKSAPVLVVTGQPGYGKLGSMINFVETNERVTIELNENQTKKQGLAISTALKEISVAI